MDPETRERSCNIKKDVFIFFVKMGTSKPPKINASNTMKLFKMVASSSYNYVTCIKETKFTRNAWRKRRGAHGAA
jgi:hypothetical protein